MTIDELIGWLEDAKASGGLTGESRVVIGRQPQYPFAHDVGATCIDRTFQVETGYGPRGEVEGVLVIAEGTHLCYGNPAWWSGETIEPENVEEDGPHLFEVRIGEEPWLGAEPGWYAGTPEGESSGPFASREDAEADLADNCPGGDPHDWHEQPGEPPHDVCISCGQIRR
jgi:hypothetical protein